MAFPFVEQGIKTYWRKHRREIARLQNGSSGILTVCPVP